MIFPFGVFIQKNRPVWAYHIHNNINILSYYFIKLVGPINNFFYGKSIIPLIIELLYYLAFSQAGMCESDLGAKESPTAKIILPSGTTLNQI